jgi:hypothetical protein
MTKKRPCKIYSLSKFRTLERFPFWEEKLVVPLIAIPNVDKANRRQVKGKKLN